MHFHACICACIENARADAQCKLSCCMGRKLFYDPCVSQNLDAMHRLELVLNLVHECMHDLKIYCPQMTPITI